MAQQLGETNYKEIIMNVDVETRDNLLEFLTLWFLMDCSRFLFELIPVSRLQNQHRERSLPNIHALKKS